MEFSNNKGQYTVQVTKNFKKVVFSLSYTDGERMTYHPENSEELKRVEKTLKEKGFVKKSF